MEEMGQIGTTVVDYAKNRSGLRAESYTVSVSKPPVCFLAGGKGCKLGVIVAGRKSHTKFTSVIDAFMLYSPCSDFVLFEP